MEKLIMIKYGELSTKKANIGLFLKQLKDIFLNLLKPNIGIDLEKFHSFGLMMKLINTLSVKNVPGN